VPDLSIGSTSAGKLWNLQVYHQYAESNAHEYVHRGIYVMLSGINIFKATGDDEALAPLRDRYEGQHHRLVRFYYECSNLRYLTSLITIPKLPQVPGLLFVR
jgi:hypothetical protein